MLRGTDQDGRPRAGDRPERHPPRPVAQGGGPLAEAGGRRVNAATLRRRLGQMLADRLPDAWDHQMMPAQGGDRGNGARAQADFLIISPGGRCHFLFAKAPEDRWWDGDLRRVAAEAPTAAERDLISRLKRAGHAARPVWSIRDAVRALTSWGCRLRPPTAMPREGTLPGDRAGEPGAARRVLTLRWKEGARNGR